VRKFSLRLSYRVWTKSLHYFRRCY